MPFEDVFSANGTLVAADVSPIYPITLLYI